MAKTKKPSGKSFDEMCKAKHRGQSLGYGRDQERARRRRAGAQK